MMTIQNYFDNLYNEANDNAQTYEEYKAAAKQIEKEEKKVARWFAEYEDLTEEERGTTKFEKWCKKHNIEIKDDLTMDCEWLLDNDRI